MFDTNTNIDEQVASAERINRRIRLARLPHGVELKDFVLSERRGISLEQLESFSDADWLSLCKDLYIHGPSASGKTYLAAALGKEWCRGGRNILFADALKFARYLDSARNTPRTIKMLDRYDALILDDIGNALRSAVSARILTPLLEHRKGRRTVVTTSNLSSWSWALFGTEHKKVLEIALENSAILELGNSCRRPLQQ